jgi:hypothetical protein
MAEKEKNQEEYALGYVKVYEHITPESNRRWYSFGKWDGTKFVDYVPKTDESTELVSEFLSIPRTHSRFK